MDIVNYAIAIGSTTLTPTSQIRLLSLKTHAALSVPVHQSLIVVSDPAALSVQVGDAVTVELGYEETLSRVFTGKVGAIAWGIDQVVLECTSSFQVLTTARFNVLYEQSTAGAIVSDVAQSRLNLSLNQVQDGMQFPTYGIGSEQTAYQHLSRLARQCGFDFYADVEDQLIFARFQPQQTHEFIYGKTILALNLEDGIAAIAGIEVYGESPASQGQGAQASSWFAKQEVKGSAGKSSGNVMRLIEPTARTQDLANQIAEALLAKSSPQKRGQMRGLGNAAVKLGDRLQLSQLPVSTHNGSFKIIGVRHTLHRRQGFCTTVNWEEEARR